MNEIIYISVIISKIDKVKKLKFRLLNNNKEFVKI
ncbi:hypothetical protein EAVVTKC53_00924 [Elizabethkingia anophelis]|nr:hypothetical protein EAVVTKC53_01793 [Elizabethkingia anophelis]CAI9679218.1 hypothetical protein EAVVTKC53_00924 [Elizabethkingia anophelis]